MVENLTVQLERERYEKSKLMEHLQRLEAEKILKNEATQ